MVAPAPAFPVGAFLISSAFLATVAVAAPAAAAAFSCFAANRLISLFAFLAPLLPAATVVALPSTPAIKLPLSVLITLPGFAGISPAVCAAFLALAVFFIRSIPALENCQPFCNALTPTPATTAIVASAPIRFPSSTSSILPVR